MGQGSESAAIGYATAGTRRSTVHGVTCDAGRRPRLSVVRTAVVPSLPPRDLPGCLTLGVPQRFGRGNCPNHLAPCRAICGGGFANLGRGKSHRGQGKEGLSRPPASLTAQVWNLAVGGMSACFEPQSGSEGLSKEAEPSNKFEISAEVIADGKDPQRYFGVTLRGLLAAHSCDFRLPGLRHYPSPLSNDRAPSDFSCNVGSIRLEFFRNYFSFFLYSSEIICFAKYRLK